MTKSKVQKVEEVKVEAVVETVAEVVKTVKVGQRAKDLILQGLDNKTVLETIKKEYPAGKTSIACIAWYKADLKKAKAVDDKPFQEWKKSQGFDDATLRAKFKASLPTTEPVTQ